MAGTQMELLGRIDERTQLILEWMPKIEAKLESQDGRLRVVENHVSSLPSAQEGIEKIDKRVESLEHDRERVKGAMAIASALGGGGGLAGIVALIKTFWP